MKNFKDNKKEKGVTLIALVVIIIILLILAGITIATLTGDNSVLKNANKAEDATKRTQIEELVRAEAVHTYDKRGEFDSEQFKDNVRDHLDRYDPEIAEDEDTITVTIDDVDVIIDKETGDIYDSTNMKPLIKVKVYQLNGEPIDPSKYYEKVIITVSIPNKDKFENLEITLKDAAGNNIEKNENVTGEGEASFTVKGEGVYTVTATGTLEGEEKKSTKKVTLEGSSTATITTSSDKVYNGKEQTGVSGNNVTWSGTRTAIDVGTYTVTATPSSNSTWSDGTKMPKTISWKINPKSVAVTWGNTTSFTYNGSPQAPTASADSGISGETLNITRTTAVEVGTHTSTASIASVTGGRAKISNYTLTGNTKTFSIVGTSITGSVQITGTNEYGSTLTAETNINPNDAILSYQWYSNTSNSTDGGTVISGATGKTYQIGSELVGKYIYVVVTARKTNYTDTEFRDITDSTNNGNAVVAKKTIVRPTMPSDKTYTYNGMDQTVSINGFDGTTMNVSGNTGTDAGDYTVTVTLKDTNNYQWSDGSTENITLNWKINPKQVVVTWEETTNFGYNGKEQGPSASADSGVSGETLNITTTKGVEIGSYTSTASIESVTGGRGKTSNYVLTNSTKAFTIGKKEIQKTSADYTGNYDGNDHTITLNVTEPTDGYTIYYSTTTSLNASNYTSGSLTKPVIKTGTVIVYWYIHATNENYSDVFGNNKITIIDNVEPTVTINPNGENIELGDSGYYCSVCQTVFQIEHYHCSVHPSEFGTSAKHTCNSIVGICGGSFEFLIEYGNFDRNCPTCMLQGIVNKATVKIKRVCSTAQSIGEPHGSFTAYSCDSHIEEVKQLIIDSHGYDYCEVRKLCDLNLVNTSTRVEAKDSIEVTLKATDEGGSGLDKLQYAWSNSNTIEPTNWENFENNETIIKNNLTEGTYYLWTNVTDKAGNRANNIKVSNPFVITRAIEKKIKPTVKSGTYTYNGKSQEVQISGFDSTTMEINGNTQADVGNYTVVITLKDPTKHQWTDGTTGSVTLNWKIVPKEVSVTWGDVTSFTYNGSPQAPTASADSGISGETLNITRTTEVSAGTHTSTASIESVTGGRKKTSNYTLTNATKAFTINKKAIQKTSGDYIGDYDGNSHTITLVVNEPRNGCNIYYSTSTRLTSSNYATSGTTSKPSRSSAGTTTVYWYIHSTNENYSDVSGSNTIIIESASPTISFSSNGGGFYQSAGSYYCSECRQSDSTPHYHCPDGHSGYKSYSYTCTTLVREPYICPGIKGQLTESVIEPGQIRCSYPGCTRWAVRQNMYGCNVCGRYMETAHNCDQHHLSEVVDDYGKEPCGETYMKSVECGKTAVKRSTYSAGSASFSSTISISPNGSNITKRRYGWSTSSTSEPTSWTTFSSNSTTAYKTSYGTSYYLWVEVTYDDGSIARKVSNEFYTY